MKKQTKILIGALIVVVLLIIAISINFPPFFKGKSSGTFGKADKYRKSVITEKDVKLRSELTADTAKLKGMVQGLMYFTVFTQDLSTQIDSCVYVFQSKGLTSTDAGYKNMMALNDYSAFIRNNNKTLSNTIGMLNSFYFKDQADQSADVEKTLRDFQNYVKNLNEKDSVLELALKSMDHFIMTTKTLKDRKAELTQLKAIRDQLLIKELQVCVLVRDRPLAGILFSYAISSQQDLNIFMAQEKIGIFSQDKVQAFSQEKLSVLSQEKLAALAQDKLSILSQEKLQGIIGARELNFVGISEIEAVMAKPDIGNIYQVVWDMANLQFVFGDKLDLKIFAATDMNAINAVNASSQLSVFLYVGLFSNQGLNIYAANIDLKGYFGASPIGIVMSSEQLNTLIESNIQVEAIASYCANVINLVVL